jgi:hypothetical protein
MAGGLMMKSKGMIVLALLLLTACARHGDTMQEPLNKIRMMAKQAIVVAVAAPCMTNATSRDQMVHASAMLLRRAMGGPEMEKVHQMMANMEQGKVPTADESLHVAIHTLGGDAFDFLDTFTAQSVPSCTEVQPLAYAATAAMLREAHTEEADKKSRQMDSEATALMQHHGKDKHAKLIDKLIKDLQQV